MSERPRMHSNKTKAKIRASQMKTWGQRLKWKRSREKFFQLWTESIANAAKIGGSDQEELDWGSYDKIKKEIALEQLQFATNKAKAKVMARLRAQRAAEARAERIAALAEKRKKGEENAKVRERRKKEKIDLSHIQGLKLKAQLTKIQKKKCMFGQVSSPGQREWEKFNIEFAKRTEHHRMVSLADQIRFARKKKVEHLDCQALTTSSAGDLGHERSTN